MKPMEPELIADYRCSLGEGALWQPARRVLNWGDIPTGRLFQYDPASGQHEQVYAAGGPVGGFTHQADGSLLLFKARGAVQIWRAGRPPETVVEEIPAVGDSRFNDVVADPAGRVYCGTMPSGGARNGSLYRLDPDGTLERILDGLGIPNGMGFTPDRRRMYFTDSTAGAIYLFDYDQLTGALTNQRVFVTVEEGGGEPDGMTVDAEGCVWSARWGGSCVVRYAPDGRELLRVALPVPKVTSVAFGGADLMDLYVTTAGGDRKALDGEGAGGLFRLRPGVRGVPEFVSGIGLTG
jgi:D-xylonolactonase